MCRPRRLAAGDHLLGTPGESLGAADAPARGGLSGGRPAAGALHPRTPGLARSPRGEPRRHRGDGHRRHRGQGSGAMKPPTSNLPRTNGVAGAGSGVAGVGSRKSGMETEEPLVNLREIAEIELFIMKRMKEFTLGDHASVFKGGGFNFVGTRDWEPGDRMSSIDWAQSSMTNFSPLITRDFEQDSNATIVAVADASLSTRCGVHGVPIAAAIARAVAAAGLSAMFFQDLFGLVTFNDQFQQLASARPRIGRSHLLYCLDLYQNRRTLEPGEERRDIIVAVETQVRKSSLVPVISAFR